MSDKINSNGNAAQSKVIITLEYFSNFYFKNYHWPIFPCNPLDKRPLTPHGFKDATTDLKIIKQWWTQWPNAMIGVPMGKASGVFCVDLDKKEGIDGTVTWLQMELMHGKCHSTLVHKTPSTGRHLLFAYVDGIRNIPLGKLGPGVEIKGEGGYIIVPPSRMANGKEYAIDQNTPAAPAPAWLINLIKNYLNRDENLENMINSDAGKGTQKEAPRDYEPISDDLLREALKNISSDGYEDWYKIGAAIRREKGESGFVFFEEWSRRSKKYNAKECMKKWKQIKDIGGISGGTILFYAEQQNPGWKSKYQQSFDFKPEPKKQEQKQAAGIIWSSEEFVNSFKPPNYLIAGLLQKQFVYSFTGPTGSGKTCIALRLAAHIITGLELSGRKVKQGKVLYFAGENPNDVLTRWIKLCEEMKIDSKSRMMYWLPGTPPLKDVEIKKKIYHAVKDIGEISMLIVDTSAAYFQGDDENSNVQLGNHARMLRAFMNLPGNPTVLVTTHPTKYPDLDNLLPRGGGAFLNEVDGNMACAMDNNLITVTWHGKWRGPEFSPLSFQLKPMKMDKLKDEDGNDIWSVITVPITTEESSRLEDIIDQRTTELMKVMLRRPGLSISELAEELGWKTSDGNPYKSMVMRMLRKLILEKKVEKRGGHYNLNKKVAEVMEKEAKKPAQQNIF